MDNENQNLYLDKEHPNQESVEEAKKKYTIDSPHPTGAYWNPTEEKWRGYKAKKGFRPPWNPWRPDVMRRKKLTINERKFLLILSVTGNTTEAYRGVYKITPMDNKKLEGARVRAAANRLLDRLRKKAPEYVKAFAFEDITPEFVRTEFMKLYNHDHITISEKIRVLELMGKTQAMFTEKNIIQETVKKVIDDVYTESDDDFNELEDSRKGRAEIERTVLMKAGHEKKINAKKD